jgi:uncharacterized repeat protein (TIGR03803 family)
MSVRNWSGSSILRSLVLLCAMFTTGSLFAQTFLTLHSFGGTADGQNPQGGLVRDAAGNLYGTTVKGGMGSGTVFKVDTANNETVLYSFTGGADGNSPLAGLIRDAAGNLYGTTVAGGAHNQGTVFKIDTSNHETVLYSFTGGADGGLPQAGVIMDATGNLYGTASQGGFGCAPLGCGTVFKIDTTNHETVLHAFMAGSDGGNPEAGLILDPAGNLYGTTFGGGSGGQGIVFKIDTTNHETVLYTFTGGSDGGGPVAGLLRDAAGNLYGTTFNGGTSGQGTVFKIDTTNHESALYSFTGGSDGGGPAAGLIRDVVGNLYGTTSQGGVGCSGLGCGTIFKINPSNGETTIYNFTGGSDGAGSMAGLLMDTTGNLYGTAYQGGTICNPPGCGTVFEFEMDNDSNFAVLNGNNTFNGNQTVNGSVSATKFAGNGSGLTSINPANISPGTANISITGNAATATSAMTANVANSALDATNADNLGNVAAANYARLDIGNAFTGNQSVNGSDAIAGSLSIGNGTPITKHLSALFNPSFPALGKITCATASFTLSGVSDGDTTAVGVPNARMTGPGNFVYTAWVSAANMITIQGCNVSGTSQTTPGTGNIRVDVWKH